MNALSPKYKPKYTEIPVRFDQSQADGDVEMKVTDNVGQFTVNIGDQRFEIGEVIIVGD